MSLVKFNNRFPWIDSMFGDVWDSGKLFHDDFALRNQMMPAINIKEKKDSFEIEMAAPGLTKKDFTVKLENDLLTISAEKVSKKEEKEEGFSRKEFNYNSFSRSVTLPESIDIDKKIEAHYDNGILNIVIFKKEEYRVIPKTKVIEIN
ncbi:MAG: Hsp20/alpha crystallin family protein [Flavobacteriaceae bacterium]|nr:Hsp20/alpha crystallin family protein [Flavobacteriaceae bacterium]